MKILVTGAGGYVGSHLVSELSEHEVTGWDNFRNAQVREIHGTEILQRDIRDLSCALSFDGDIVIHLAAMSGVDDCANNPEEAYLTNVVGTQNIAYLCYRRKIPLLFACSAAVFGTPRQVPIRATHPRAPLNFYGTTKAWGERIIQAVSTSRFPAYVFIITNIYGHHQIDGKNIEKPTVVNRFVSAAREGRPLTVYDPGTQARNFIHVRDVSGAFRRAAEVIKGEENGCTTFPLACESWTIGSLASFVRECAERRGYHTTIEHIDNPREETLAPDFTVDMSAFDEKFRFPIQDRLMQSVETMIGDENP